jgi:hypothetical protein
MAAEEIPGLEKSIARLSEDLQYALLPADPNEDRDALIEIRAGAGGDEASLFAAELMRAYQRYSDIRGWKCEHLESSPSEVGGFKEVILKITGDEVFRFLKYESGVHRVQRVPATETQGRVHTSTVTVAVLPEAEEVDVELNPTTSASRSAARAAPGASTSTAPNPPCRFSTFPPGSMSAARTAARRSKTRNSRCKSSAPNSTNRKCASNRTPTRRTAAR